MVSVLKALEEDFAIIVEGTKTVSERHHQQQYADTYKKVLIHILHQRIGKVMELVSFLVENEMKLGKDETTLQVLKRASLEEWYITLQPEWILKCSTTEWSAMHNLASSGDCITVGGRHV